MDILRLSRAAQAYYEGLKAPSLVQGWEFQPTLPHGERLSPSIFLIFN